MSQQFKCRIGWHDWGKWEDTIIEVTPSPWNMPIHELKTECDGQRRVCKCCGKRELKTL